jgi:hypothetical protein
MARMTKDPMRPGSGTPTNKRRDNETRKGTNKFRSAGTTWKLLLLWWLLVAAVTVRAQRFDIDVFTISSGGAHHRGVYSLSATIGQPDAGALSAADIRFDGGFWSVVAAIQTTNAPRLSVKRSAMNTIIISWAAASTGFELQQNPDLNPANWTAVGTPPLTVGEEKQVMVPMPLGRRFYRLRKP